MIKKTLKLKVKKDGLNVPIVIRPEIYSVAQKIKIIYAQKYRELIELKVPTKSAMLDLLRKEGLWSDEEENRYSDLIIQLSVTEALLENTQDEVRQKDLVVKLTKLRNELFELIQIKSEPLELVAETIAEEIKAEHYLVESTFYADGKQYFQSYEDFKNRRYDEDVEKILKSFIQAINVRNTKQLLTLPENRWMVKHGMMNDIGEITDDSIWKDIEDEPKVDIKTDKTVETITQEITKDS